VIYAFMYSEVSSFQVFQRKFCTYFLFRRVRYMPSSPLFTLVTLIPFQYPILKYP
jgi:hypothetical protein